MAAVGSRIVVEAEKVAQPARSGVIEEVLQERPPRYRVRWDDGHESIIAPASGAARVERAETGAVGA
ncbi:MAG TPA: DUF1918 domain-containing protein [Gaiellaceae bacterium]|nr:DUF1918 domain-containing protein [Gaiellaceae bacterium]